MRILRTSAETPAFENLLISTSGDEPGRPEATGLPDPFASAPTAMSERATEPPLEHEDPFPGRSLAPWRPYRRDSTFLRAVGLEHTRCVATLRQWGARGVVELGPSELAIPSKLAQHPGRHTIEVRLRRRAPWSVAIPMELELVPWSQTFATTWLVLCPRRRVRLSRRYFRAGHAFLDRLVTELLVRAG